MEFQQEKTQLMHIWDKNGFLVQESLAGAITDLSQQNPPPKDKLWINLELLMDAAATCRAVQSLVLTLCHRFDEE